MLLTYLDESYTKERYFIGALLVPDSEARSLTKALDDVVEKASSSYGSRVVRSEAELHGYDLVNAKADWVGLASQVRSRIGIYNEAMQAIADHDVRVIVRSVDIPGLDARHPNGHDHPHSVVLTHLIERVDEYAEKVDDRALLIADEVDGQADYRRDLWNYQRLWTWGYRSRQITRVVDTLHFAPSTSSRLVQAADLVTFMARRIAVHPETDPRAARANQALWERIGPRVIHNGCWYPRPR